MLKNSFLLATGLLLIGFCLPLAAQSTGGVKGKVRTMAGSTIAGATITARQNGEDVKSTKSGGKGEFLLDGLRSGVYNVVFDAKGYSSGIKYNVEIKANKTQDLGDRLIMSVDRGTKVIVQGSVFFKDGTSVAGVEVRIDRIGSDGSVKKLGTVMTNIAGEFAFSQPEGAAKYRMTVKYKDLTTTKEIEAPSAAVYNTAISLPVSRNDQ